MKATGKLTATEFPTRIALRVVDPNLFIGTRPDNKNILKNLEERFAIVQEKFSHDDPTEKEGNRRRSPRVKRENRAEILKAFPDEQERLSAKEVVERIATDKNIRRVSRPTTYRGLDQLADDGFLLTSVKRNKGGRRVVAYRLGKPGGPLKDSNEVVNRLLETVTDPIAAAGSFPLIVRHILDENSVVEKERILLTLRKILSESIEPRTIDIGLWIALSLVWRDEDAYEWVQSNRDLIFEMGVQSFLLQSGILLGISADQEILDWLFCKLTGGSAEDKLLLPPANMEWASALFSLAIAGHYGKVEEVTDGCVRTLKDRGGSILGISRAVAWILRSLDKEFLERPFPHRTPDDPIYKSAGIPSLKEVDFPEDLNDPIDMTAWLLSSIVWEEMEAPSEDKERTAPKDKVRLALADWYQNHLRIDRKR